MSVKATVSAAILSIVAISLIGDSFANDYCNIKSCKGHTMCRFQSPKPSYKCKKYFGSGFTDEEKQAMVNVHNELRRKVASGEEKHGKPGPQPRAKQMPDLVWDDELAMIAQRWADQCNFGHDQCRNVERFRVGQNIALIGTTASMDSLKVESMINSWYNEVKNVNRNDVSKFRSVPGPVIGHYTQVVWAETTTIGCGLTKYNEGKFNKFYLVCNYGPAGNFLGQPVYEIA